MSNVSVASDRVRLVESRAVLEQREASVDVAPHGCLVQRSLTVLDSHQMDYGSASGVTLPASRTSCD